MNKIRQRILSLPNLFFLKGDLTGTMGLLRHFATDMVNTVLDELIKYELIRLGREYSFFWITFDSWLKRKNFQIK